MENSNKFVDGVITNFFYMKNIYKEKLELGAYYTYNKDNQKVYDIKTMRKDFKELIGKLKK